MNKKPFIIEQSGSCIVQDWKLRDNPNAIDEAIEWLKSRAQLLADSNRRVVIDGKWQYGDEIILWDTLNVTVSTYIFEADEELPENCIPTANHNVSIEYKSHFYPHD
jgi:hypothetical protein